MAATTDAIEPPVRITVTTVSRMALDLSRGGDAAAYVTEAKTVADNHQLDLLEFVAADGSIISSAQWPARCWTRY